MKVKFNEVMAGPEVLFTTEGIYDVEKNLAKRLIDKNICRVATPGEVALSEEDAEIAAKVHTTAVAVNETREKELTKVEKAEVKDIADQAKAREKEEKEEAKPTAKK